MGKTPSVLAIVFEFAHLHSPLSSFRVQACFGHVGHKRNIRRSTDSNIRVSPIIFLCISASPYTSRHPERKRERESTGIKASSTALYTVQKMDQLLQICRISINEFSIIEKVTPLGCSTTRAEFSY